MTAGAPWWLTIFLTLFAAYGAHALTVRREREKHAKDVIAKWRVDIKSQLQKISDAAVRHYVSPEEVAKTAVSSALILNELKRLQAAARETRCVDAHHSATWARAYRMYHATITDPDDFQNESRTVRPANDAIASDIREAESTLLQELRHLREQGP